MPKVNKVDRSAGRQTGIMVRVSVLRERETDRQTDSMARVSMQTMLQ